MSGFVRFATCGWATYHCDKDTTLAAKPDNFTHRQEAVMTETHLDRNHIRHERCCGVGVCRLFCVWPPKARFLAMVLSVTQVRVVLPVFVVK